MDEILEQKIFLQRSDRLSQKVNSHGLIDTSIAISQVKSCSSISSISIHPGVSIHRVLWYFFHVIKIISLTSLLPIKPLLSAVVIGRIPFILLIISIFRYFLDFVLSFELMAA